MAYITASADRSPRLRAQIGHFFTALGHAFEAFAEARSRRDQIERLNQLSDAQLARMGIRRDQIVHHVFRDQMAL